jgi:Glycosyltransferase sugar-binding region containing DXD motif
VPQGVHEPSKEAPRTSSIESSPEEEQKKLNRAYENAPLPSNNFSGGISNTAAKAPRTTASLPNTIKQSAQSLKERALGYPAIPQKLHIVHFGDTLPPNVKKNVEQWAEKNPNWEKNVWVDKSYLSPQQMSELKQHADKNGYNLRYVNDEIYKNPPHPRLALARERASGKQLQAIETSPELKEGLKAQGQKVPDKNWGVVSDLARVEILMKEGGVYLDTDMAPGQRLPDKLRAKNGFLANIKGHSDTVPANDIIATTPNNKVLRTYADDISDRYFKAVNHADDEKAAGGRVHDYSPERVAKLNNLGVDNGLLGYNENDLFDNKGQRTPTLRVSGPTALKYSLNKADPSLKMVKPSLDIKDYEAKGYRFPPQYVADHQVSDNSWLKPDSSSAAPNNSSAPSATPSQESLQYEEQ